MPRRWPKPLDIKAHLERMKDNMIITAMLKSLRRIRESAAIVIIEEVVIPWYSERAAVSAPTAQDGLNIHKEVATKLLEAVVGVEWAYRHGPEELEGHFLVTDLTVDVEDNVYVYSVHFIPLGDVEAEVSELPLHAFLQVFQPVGDATKLKMYDA